MKRGMLRIDLIAHFRQLAEAIGDFGDFAGMAQLAPTRNAVSRPKSADSRAKTGRYLAFLPSMSRNWLMRK